MIQFVIHAVTAEGPQRTLTLGLSHVELADLARGESLRIRLASLDVASDLLTDVVLAAGPTEEQLVAEAVGAGLLDEAAAHRLMEEGVVEDGGVGSPHLGR